MFNGNTFEATKMRIHPRSDTHAHTTVTTFTRPHRRLLGVVSVREKRNGDFSSLEVKRVARDHRTIVEILVPMLNRVQECTHIGSLKPVRGQHLVGGIPKGLV